jgi:uracil-DNA glycosylase
MIMIFYHGSTEWMEDCMLEESWAKDLASEFTKPYMQQLRTFLLQEKEQGKIIYPKNKEIFNAFALTPFDNVKVVILGQDPYHGPGQAHGLCFSVLPPVPPPPSLVNIYKELQNDLGIPRPSTGSLIKWAKQGVLLLNSVLTVEKGLAASHQKRGWEEFTDRVIALLNEQKQGLVFLLWGSYAQRKGQFINTTRHCVLKAPHPSPLSAHQGFLGCRHFSTANRYLQSVQKEPIDWQLE